MEENSARELEICEECIRDELPKREEMRTQMGLLQSLTEGVKM